MIVFYWTWCYFWKFVKHSVPNHQTRFSLFGAHQWCVGTEPASLQTVALSVNHYSTRAEIFDKFVMFLSFVSHVTLTQGPWIVYMEVDTHHGSQITEKAGELPIYTACYFYLQHRRKYCNLIWYYHNLKQNTKPVQMQYLDINSISCSKCAVPSCCL